MVPAPSKNEQAAENPSAAPEPQVAQQPPVQQPPAQQPQQLGDVPPETAEEPCSPQGSPVHAAAALGPFQASGGGHCMRTPCLGPRAGRHSSNSPSRGLCSPGLRLGALQTPSFAEGSAPRRALAAPVAPASVASLFSVDRALNGGPGAAQIDACIQGMSGLGLQGTACSPASECADGSASLAGAQQCAADIEEASAQSVSAHVMLSSDADVTGNSPEQDELTSRPAAAGAAAWQYQPGSPLQHPWPAHNSAAAQLSTASRVCAQAQAAAQDQPGKRTECRSDQPVPGRMPRRRAHQGGQVPEQQNDQLRADCSARACATQRGSNPRGEPARCKKQGRRVAWQEQAATAMSSQQGHALEPARLRGQLLAKTPELLPQNREQLYQGGSHAVCMSSFCVADSLLPTDAKQRPAQQGSVKVSKGMLHVPVAADACGAALQPAPPPGAPHAKPFIRRRHRRAQSLKAKPPHNLRAARTVAHTSAWRPACCADDGSTMSLPAGPVLARRRSLSHDRVRASAQPANPFAHFEECLPQATAAAQVERLQQAKCFKAGRHRRSCSAGQASQASGQPAFCEGNSLTEQCPLRPTRSYENASAEAAEAAAPFVASQRGVLLPNADDMAQGIGAAAVGGRGSTQQTRELQIRAPRIGDQRLDWHCAAQAWTPQVTTGAALFSAGLDAAESCPVPSPQRKHVDALPAYSEELSKRRLRQPARERVAHGDTRFFQGFSAWREVSFFSLPVRLFACTRLRLFLFRTCTF